MCHLLLFLLLAFSVALYLSVGWTDLSLSWIGSRLCWSAAIFPFGDAARGLVSQCGDGVEAFWCFGFSRRRLCHVSFIIDSAILSMFSPLGHRSGRIGKGTSSCGKLSSYISLSTRDDIVVTSLTSVYVYARKGITENCYKTYEHLCAHRVYLVSAIIIVFAILNTSKTGVWRLNIAARYGTSYKNLLLLMKI